MSDKLKLSIPFKLAKIEEDQFSVFEENLESESPVQEKISIGFGGEVEDRIVAASINYQLLKDKQPFIHIKVACYFEIEAKAFKEKLHKEDSIELPKEFARHLANITVGTARGILFSNTKNTPFSEYPMRLVNLKRILKENIHIELK